MDRKSWDKHFMDKAKETAEMSTCLRRQVGAVIVRDKRPIAEGYNGAPTKAPHCKETGCLREKLKIPSGERQELCRAVHAEQNALMQAAKFGTSVDGATIYITCRPCSLCAKMLVNAGIAKIVYDGYYPDELAEQILREAPWIKVEIYNENKIII